MSALAQDPAFIARALGGYRVGLGWIVRCPAHDDRSPSLSMRRCDGKLLVRCHAGCSHAQVIAALRERGLWKGDHGSRGRRVRPERRPAPTENLEHDIRRTRAALHVWHTVTPGSGTLVETYLRSRSILFPPPPTVRFHPGLKHRSGGIWPAMIAPVTHGIDGRLLAVHRTFLSRTGSGKAPVEPQKMMLGPCRGGAVQLAPAGEVLMVGEGIETCLAAMQATKLPAWAALSTSGLRSLDLPTCVQEVVVLADGDEPGEAAAHDAALRWKREGRRARIARPPRGLDFNDLLVGRLPPAEECAA